MKFGITEAGDASLDYAWVDKMNTVEGAILITKNITDKFISEALKVKDKVIIHATCTGYGGTVLEPNIPVYTQQLDQVKKLISMGFPSQQIVIRIDPIIPTEKGMDKVEAVIRYIRNDVKRFRISVLDVYPHVRERFANVEIPVPYDGMFQASKEDFKELNNFLKAMKVLYSVQFESCAETLLPETSSIGCVSQLDLAVLGLPMPMYDIELKGQRKTCSCIACKTELLTHKGHRNGYGCEYKCLYCYWK